jgi:hypothetical protein
MLISSQGIGKSKAYASSIQGSTTSPDGRTYLK